MADEPRREQRRTSAQGRQDGDYDVEFTNPPKGGPIPPHRPTGNEQPPDETNPTA